MSGAGASSDMEEKSWFDQELVRESGNLSVSMGTLADDMGSVDNVSRVALIKHMGPVSQRDRFISFVGQAMPYILAALSVIVLVLIPALASTISKVHSVDAQGSQLEENINMVKREGQEHMKQVQDLFEKRLADLETKTGPPGQKGSSGRSGEKGSKGDNGLMGGRGPSGLNGVKGDRGEKGKLGDQGAKGEKGLPGPKGDSAQTAQGLGIQGPRGERGPAGPKGEKGDNFIPLLTWDWTHEAGKKADRFDFKIVCLARCKSLEVLITHSAGDVDLYGEADEVPHIVNSNCDRCELCKARSSQVKDKCVIERAPSSTFYITVYAHKAYRSLEIVVEASNLSNITCVSNNCGGEVKSTLNLE